MGGNFGSPQRIGTGSACVSGLNRGQLNPVCHFFGNAGWIRETESSPGTAFISGFGRTSYENGIRLRRVLSYRYPVNRIAVQPERYGNVTNRNGLRHPASQRHGRSAEASGKAATAGGNATRVRSGTPSGPDIAIHSNGDWDAVGCAGSCHGEACPARERGQQLQRWL